MLNDKEKGKKPAERRMIKVWNDDNDDNDNNNVDIKSAPKQISKMAFMKDKDSIMDWGMMLLHYGDLIIARKFGMINWSWS